MPVSSPPSVALAEFLGATTRHTRRVEIYEADGTTRWARDTVVRLKTGSVSVDYSRNERRTVELTLANDDGVLVNAPGEFWYDKIIKVYRGVRVNQPYRLPRILILSDKTGTDTLAPSFRQRLVSLGYGDVRVNTLASVYAADVEPYDIIVGLGSATSGQLALLKQAYSNGKSVFVQDVDAVAWIESQFAGAFTSNNSSDYNIVANPLATNSVASGWQSFTQTSAVAMKDYSVTSTQATKIALDQTNNTYAKILAFNEPSRGGRAVALSFSITSDQYDVPQFTNLMASTFKWLNTVKPISEWEVQIGEFMIDRITEPNFPYEMRITGRDYTKKCLLSKFSQAIQFDAGYSVEGLIASIAGAAGVTKRSLPVTGKTVARKFYFDRGVDRWTAMKEIADAYNYEIFFDATGFLTMREYRDPTASAPTVWVNTGADGQLASYEKSTSDARLYNSIVVTGESSDASIPPVSATAQNTTAGSPTSIAAIGERLYQYTSSFITTQAQAQSVADSFLAVHALEEFELSFDSLVLPWLEVGDILGWIDPRPAPDDPTAFLLSTLTLPLDLAAMSATAKRVTIVG